MTVLQSLLSNHMLVCALLAYAMAQIIKFLIFIIRDRKVEFAMLLSAGGMPSSHAATVMSLTVSSVRQYGFDSPYFAICMIFAGIVMYDATGVRRAAGEHAKVINKLLSDLASSDPAVQEAGLKELIGHTPFQVAVGALLGFVIPFLVPLP